jgi:hypothetical protein
VAARVTLDWKRVEDDRPHHQTVDAAMTRHFLVVGLVGVLVLGTGGPRGATGHWRHRRCRPCP